LNPPGLRLTFREWLYQAFRPTTHPTTTAGLSPAPASSAGNRRPAIPALQILRACAAIMVVFHHFSLTIHSYHPGASFFVRSGLGALGAAGVDTFFVISGFIMVWTGREESRSIRKAFQFLRKRALRIYPLYWIWTSVLLLMWAFSLALTSAVLSPGYVLASYLLWPVHNGRQMLHPLLDQGWTLSFEIYFYLVFALSIAWRPVASRLTFLLGTFLVLGVLCFVLSGGNSVRCDPLVIEFVLGTIAGTIALHAWRRGGVPRALSFGLIALGSALMIASVGLQQVLSLEGDLPRVLLWGGAAFLTVTGAGLLPPNAFQGRRVLIFLGDASYSIYLTHAFATLALGTLMRDRGLADSIQPDLLILVATFITVAVCACTYPLLEKPLLARMNRTSRQRH
jgi:exopolysaccharide production protein ExoZ